MARPRSDISQRIIRAARARFLHDGVDGASQRQIAREAGTNLGMVYYYHPTKDQLFLAVLEDVYAPLVSDLERALRHDAPVETRLHRLFARLAALTDDEVDVLRIVVREALISNERRRQVLERFMTGHLGLIIATVADGIQSGAFRAIDPPVVLVAAIAGVGLVPQVVRRVAGHDISPFVQLPTGEPYADIALEVLLHGIANTKAGADRERSRTRAKPAVQGRTKNPGARRGR